METKKIITTTTTTTTTVTTETIATTNNTATVKKHLPLDGISAKTNQVLCPVVLSINEWPSLENIIRDNLEKFTCCGQTFYIGYVATDIPAGSSASEVYDAKNKDKNKLINDYLKPYRKGRCVRGHEIDGTPILCWKKSCKGCTGCNENGIPYERFNPQKPFTEVSLEAHIEETGIDFADKPTVFYGDEEESPYANDEERLVALLHHLKENYPRHYKAFLMIKDNKSAEEICEALGFASGSKRVYTIMEETMHICYKFFGSGVLSTKAILDHKRRAKEAKKNLLF